MSEMDPAANPTAHPAEDVRRVRRAGHVHDLGKVGISAGICGKEGPLTEREWDKVRLHPYYTERLLARPSQLADIGAVAGLHHERLDGSGYHRGAPAAMLSSAARVLAAANTYCASTERRAHRPVLPPEKAAAALTISYKTVDRHTQNIYAKIGVSTRAGATLFAMENHLLSSSR